MLLFSPHPQPVWADDWPPEPGSAGGFFLKSLKMSFSFPLSPSACWRSMGHYHSWLSHLTFWWWTLIRVQLISWLINQQKKINYKNLDSWLTITVKASKLRGFLLFLIRHHFLSVCCFHKWNNFKMSPWAWEKMKFWHFIDRTNNIHLPALIFTRLCLTYQDFPI